MFGRYGTFGLPLLCFAAALTGCGNPSGLDFIQVTPTADSLTSGQTLQLNAVGTYGNAKHPTTQNITGQVSWSSTAPTVASVSASGLVTAVGAGTATITASAMAYNGTVSASAAVTVTGSTSSSGASGSNMLSLTIIPSSITVGNLQDTGQFLAIGTFSTAPFVRDLTNSSTLNWVSSVPSVFPVNTNTAGSLGATAGIVTAYGNGSAVIIAEAKNPSDGTLQTATATFNCPLVQPTATAPGTCYPGSQTPALLATLTVYNEGLNTTSWLVTAPSATGTPNVIHCGPGEPSGSSVCVATYPVGATVTLTAPATTAAFGGWSSNCAQQGTITAAGPNSCTVTLTTNDSVGAIFN